MTTLHQPFPQPNDPVPGRPIVDPEFSALVPPLQPDERSLLEQSLTNDGCRDPLVLWKETGILLDGHNRLDICTALDIPFNTTTLSFETRDEAKLWVIETQFGRRNLSAIDRINLASQYEPLLKACVAKNQGARTDLRQNSAEGSEPQRTRELAARAAGVSHDTYDKGKFVLLNGTPELVQAVQDDEVSIHAAAKVAELPVEEQVEVVASGTVTETANKMRGNRRTKNTGNNEWGTPRDFLNYVRTVLGTIDLDPATHLGAQSRVQATQFYTADDDGLTKPWHGNVFLNPPYATRLINRFVQKLVDEYVAGNVTAAILLVNNETEAGWFQKAASHAQHICFPNARIRFLRADGVRSKHGPLQGQAVFYFGSNGSKFLEVFSKFGLVVTPACVTPLEV